MYSNYHPKWKSTFWRWLVAYRPLFSRGDIDASLAQFFNTIISLMLIVTVCQVCVLPECNRGLCACSLSDNYQS